MKNMKKKRYSDPDPDPLLRKGGSKDPDPLFPIVDPRIRIHVKMRWIRNDDCNANDRRILFLTVANHLTRGKGRYQNK